ncbi:MAG: acetate/propionate family kinase [Actinophytocola sp.]|nr:acetate/propionate family kinase [Actinophytocola sp.]
MTVLTVNAGSSSVKLRVVGPDGTVLAAADDSTLLREMPEVAAIGHRVVHGGPALTAPARIDDDVRRRIAEADELAPLHNRRALDGIDLAREVAPELPQVACFDTAFHATLPDAAATYPLPAAWRQRWGLRRYGFHGLSHGYAARRAAALLGRDPAGLRVVTCHLGAGASLCAVDGGRSVDTTMGFTPLEGLVMATRSGSVDPGLLLWLLRQGLDVNELADGLEQRSGLAGLAGSGDMREVRQAAEAGAEPARRALAVYRHRLCREIAAMAAALGGLDALVFTGGIGEHDAALRAEVCARLEFLGVGVDDADTSAGDADREIGAPGRPVRVLVVESREDLELAEQTRRVLTSHRRQTAGP